MMHALLILGSLIPAVQATTAQVLPLEFHEPRLTTPAVATGARVTALHWADFDRDGRRDAFALTAGEGALLSNDGAGTFIDVTAQVGLDLTGGVSDIAWGDFDADGWSDLLIVDRRGAVRVWKSAEGRTFKALGPLSGLPEVNGVLAGSWLDFDGDGLLDLHLVEPSGHAVFRGIGKETFEAVTLELAPAQVGAGVPLGAAVPVDPAAGKNPAGPGTPPAGRDSQAGGGGGSSLVVGPGPSSVVSSNGGTLAAFTPQCDPTIEDASNGGCLAASSVPTLGLLYPQSDAFNVTAASGKVNIGTTTASVFQLHVVGTERQLLLSASGPDNSVNITAEPSGSGGLYVNAVGGGEFVAFTNTGGETLRIDSQGNVGVGTTAPDARLDVAGGARLRGAEGLEFVDGGERVSVLTGDQTGMTWDLSPDGPAPAGDLTILGSTVDVSQPELRVGVIRYADDTIQDSSNEDWLVNLQTGVDENHNAIEGINDNGIDYAQALLVDGDPSTIEYLNGPILTQLEGPGGINETLLDHGGLLSHFDFLGGNMEVDVPMRMLNGLQLSNNGNVTSIDMLANGRLQLNSAGGFEFADASGTMTLDLLPDGGVRLNARSLSINNPATGESTIIDPALGLMTTAEVSASNLTTSGNMTFSYDIKGFPSSTSISTSTGDLEVSGGMNLQGALSVAQGGNWGGVSMLGSDLGLWGGGFRLRNQFTNDSVRMGVEPAGIFNFGAATPILSIETGVRTEGLEITNGTDDVSVLIPANGSPHDGAIEIHANEIRVITPTADEGIGTGTIPLGGGTQEAIAVEGLMSSKTNTGGTAVGVYSEVTGEGTDAYGVYGTVAASAASGTKVGVHGAGGNVGFGVTGLTNSASAYGVVGTNTAATGGTGVLGFSQSTNASSSNRGVYGWSESQLGSGVYGYGFNGNGATTTYGVQGISTASAGFGVYGLATASGSNTGVYGETQSTSSSANGVYGLFAGALAADGVGVKGESIPVPYYGIGGQFEGGWFGVEGRSTIAGTGLRYGGRFTGTGGATANYGIYTSATDPAAGGNAYGIYSYAPSTSGQAARFDGQVTVTGTLSKGGGSFKIDHPLDPENKYLYHSFVESPDMMNVYNGNVILDEAGKTTVELPEWMETLNRDFRYQLTAIGAPGPMLYVSEKVNDNHFSIAGGQPHSEVSWQITGIRQDSWAEKNRIPVEELKGPQERGLYLHPEARGLSETAGVDYQLHRRALLEKDAARQQAPR